MRSTLGSAYTTLRESEKAERVPWDADARRLPVQGRRLIHVQQLTGHGRIEVVDSLNRMVTELDSGRVDIYIDSPFPTGFVLQHSDIKVLLLDEPLGALDRKLREHTQFELVNIQERLGLTFVIVTHDPALAARMDRVLQLADGVLAARSA